jgi:hypothetical protein
LFILYSSGSEYTKPHVHNQLSHLANLDVGI